METIRVLLRADLRRRWRSWVAVTLLVAAVGGVAMASFAAAQRTSTAMDRFVEHYRPMDVYGEGIVDLDDLAEIPGVQEVSSGAYYLMVPVIDGVSRPELIGVVSPFSYTNGATFRRFDRSIVVAGNLPDPADALQIAVDEQLAEAHDLHPGDRFPMQAYAPEQGVEVFEDIGRLEPEGPTFDLVVSAIVRAPQDVVAKPNVPDVVYLGSSEVFLGPAFDAAHQGVDVLDLGTIFGPNPVTAFELLVDFAATDRDQLLAAVGALDPEAIVEFGGSDALVARSEAKRSIDLQASLVVAFAVLVTLGGAVLVAQALRRQAEDDAVHRGALLAVGVEPAALLRLTIVRSAAVGGAGALLGACLAVALSPLGPVGFARRAEIDPGMEVRPTVLLIGMALVLLLVTATSAALAWRQATAARRPVRRGSGLGDRAARWGLPAPAVAGMRAATLGGGGRTVAAIVLVAAVGVVGGATFAGSEQKLANDPALWGWTWDFAVGDGNDPTIGERAPTLFGANDDIESFAAVFDLDAVELRAGDRSLDSEGSGIEVAQGHIEPRMLRGSSPSSPHEIALGGATAARLGVGVGDEVLVRLEGTEAPYTVSGIAVMNLGFDSDRIGEGSLFTVEGVERAGAEPGPTTFLVDFAPGTDLDEAYAALRRDWGNTVLRPVVPIDVFHLDTVRHLPMVFSLLIAGVGAVTLAFVLTLAVRHGRRDLALLRTLGFDTRQMRMAVAVQATTLVVPAALVGAALGVVGGRLAWRMVADGLGAPSVPVMSLGAAAGVVVGGVALGNLIAAIPGRIASRTQPAIALRSE
jgi:putative ABC transport system permease protein